VPVAGSTAPVIVEVTGVDDTTHREEISMTNARPRVPGEDGITTAEYAVGTAAGAGFAGLLYAMLSGGFGNALLTKLFDHVLALLGLG